MWICPRSHQIQGSQYLLCSMLYQISFLERRNSFLFCIFQQAYLFRDNVTHILYSSEVNDLPTKVDYIRRTKAHILTGTLESFWVATQEPLGTMLLIFISALHLADINVSLSTRNNFLPLRWLCFPPRRHFFFFIL